MKRHATLILSVSILILTMWAVMPVSLLAQNKKAEGDIIRTGELIRKAITDQDLATFRSFLHPDVIKAMEYDKVLIGQEAVTADMAATFKDYDLVIMENHIEHLLIQGDVAIEQSLFSIRVVPKDGGTPFVYKGRTMITYTRHIESPTGWATLREIIQSANP